MSAAGPVRSPSHPPDARQPCGPGSPLPVSYRTFEPEPLWYISLYMLGSAAYWREVADTNRNALADLEPLERDTVVPAGRTLELPDPRPRHLR